MSLGPGMRLGPYEVLSPLGAGGMGVVWRARDTRLGRDVALKILPEDLSGSAERRSRLDQEARLLASLNHPRIAALYDVLEHEGSPVLVMEVVEGETLDERLARGALPLGSALDLALPIAEALDAAHERGILHRDLKPSNVKLPPGGGVKLLDFGLAKTLELEGDLSSAATLVKRMERTDSGVAVGTAPYMSPEQARGEPVNRRTDIWAFGCVLFEMVTGKRAFPGATRADVIAAVLEREPDWNRLLPGTPDGLVRILKRCLQKDKNHRARDIADVKLEIEELRSEILSGRGRAPRRRSARALAVAGLAALVVLGALGAFVLSRLHRDGPPADARAPRFQLSLPRSVSLLEMGRSSSTFAISPDGGTVAFVGCSTASSCQLYLRAPSEIDARALAGTENAESPFFSPDGRFLGFGAQGKLKTIDLRSGVVVVLAEAPQFRGGTWGEDGSIVFSPAAGGLRSIPAQGGESREVTRLDTGLTEGTHRWPHLLPGGRALLFNVSYDRTSRGSRGWDVAVADLSSGEKRILIEGAGYPRYAAGNVLAARDGVVVGAPLDLDTLELQRPPVPVLEGVFMWSSPGENNSMGGVAYYDVNRDGALLFTPREPHLPRRTVVTVDRNGLRRRISSSERAYTRPIFSPDGRHVAVSVESDVGTWEAFVLELASEAWTRVADTSPWAFLPDGRRVLVGRGIEIASLDGSEPPVPIFEGRDVAFASVAPDGRNALFGIQAAPRQFDIWRARLDRGSDPEPWLATSSSEGSARFSPDGRFVVYQSDDSGRDEVYLRPFAESGGRRQISIQGGSTPRWARDGGEIFFVSQGSLWSAQAAAIGDPDPPRKLFDLPDELLADLEFYDVSPDGQSFVMIEKDAFELRPLDLVIVPEWREELDARLSAPKH